MGHAGFQDAIDDFYAFVRANHVFVNAFVSSNHPFVNAFVNATLMLLLMVTDHWSGGNALQ